MRGTSKKIALCVVGVSLSLLGAELLLRATSNTREKRLVVFDPLIGRKLRPGMEGFWQREGHGRYKFNSYGFRDREWQMRKADTRVAVLGDSFAEALQVDLDKTFHEVAERKLGKTEVMNFGVSGQSTLAQLLTYRHYVRQFHADLVVLAFFSGNDVADNWDYTRPSWRYPAKIELISPGNVRVLQSKRCITIQTIYRLLDWAIYHSACVQRLYEIRQRWQHGRLMDATDEAGLWPGSFGSFESKGWEEMWELAEQLILKLRDEIAADTGRQTSLLVMPVTRGVQVHAEMREKFKRDYPHLDPDYAEKRLASFCGKHGIQFLALGEAFLAYNVRTGKMLHGFGGQGYGHWNEEGHRLAGELLAAKIKDLTNAHGAD